MAEQELHELLAPSQSDLSSESIIAAYRRLQSFFVRTYHLKDALKGEVSSTGVAAAVVESTIDQDRDLTLLADLANLEKHVNLTKGARSGSVPRVVVVDGVGLTAGGWRLHLGIAHRGATVDGLDLAARAMEAWRRALISWGLI